MVLGIWDDSGWLSYRLWGFWGLHFCLFVSTYLDCLSWLRFVISLHGDLSGWFARTPSILHRVGHVLLQLNAVEPRRPRRLIFADDVFQLSKVPKLKTVHVISKAIESLSGCKLLGFMKYTDIVCEFSRGFNVLS